MNSRLLAMLLSVAFTASLGADEGTSPPPAVEADTPTATEPESTAVYVSDATTTDTTVPSSLTLDALLNESTGLFANPQQRIAEALRSELSPSLEPRLNDFASDPVLEEVLELIRQRGSLLEGTTLDQYAQEFQAAPSPPETSVESIEAAIAVETVEEVVRDDPVGQALTAQRLLQAARSLEVISQRPADQQLIKRMRTAARDLLLEAFPLEESETPVMSPTQEPSESSEPEIALGD